MSAHLAALLPSLSIRDYVEIALLFLALYAFLRFLRRTVAGGMLRGPAIVAWLFVFGLFYTLRLFDLAVLDYILTRTVPFLLIALVVVFQPEFRHGLARLGDLKLFRSLLRRERKAKEIRAVDELIAAVTAFAKRKTGALVAIERNVDLTPYIDTGVRLDALIRAETLDTIFSTETILHDGAVIVRGDRIAAAGCLLPVTDRLDLARNFGTRHRAAIGLSEQSDAVVVIVSEETGRISIAERGTLEPYPDPKWLSAHLSVVMAEKQGVAPVAP
jgi:diadenylate cyclase